MLPLSHPGGPRRKYAKITLPGSLKNGVYSHDESDGHATSREYVDVIVRQKDNDANKVELHFKYLLAVADDGGSERKILTEYDTSSNRKHGYKVVEYNIADVQNVLLDIPENATLVPGFYPMGHYNDSLGQTVASNYTVASLSGITISSTPKYHSTALTIDTNFTNKTLLSVRNSGRIIGMGGGPASTVLPRAYSVGAARFDDDIVTTELRNYHSLSNEPVLYGGGTQLTSSADGGGRRMDTNVDGEDNSGTNTLAGVPVSEHQDHYLKNGFFQQYHCPEIPMDAIRIKADESIENAVINIVNTETGQILPGGGAGGNGPVCDINYLATSGNFHYQSNYTYGINAGTAPYLGSATSFSSFSTSGNMPTSSYHPSPIGHGHRINGWNNDGFILSYSPTTPKTGGGIVYPLIGGGRGGRGAGWHYNNHFEIDTSTGQRKSGTGHWGVMGFFQNGAQERYDDSVKNEANRYRYAADNLASYIGTTLSTHFYDGSFSADMRGVTNSSIRYASNLYNFEYGYIQANGTVQVPHNSRPYDSATSAGRTGGNYRFKGFRVGWWGGMPGSITSSDGARPFEQRTYTVSPPAGPGYTNQNLIYKKGNPSIPGESETNVFAQENAKMIPDHRGTPGIFPGAVGYDRGGLGMPNCTNGAEPVPFDSATTVPNYRYFYYRNMGGHGGGFGQDGSDARAFPNNQNPFYEHHGDSYWQIGVGGSYINQNVSDVSWRQVGAGKGGKGGKSITVKSYTNPSGNFGESSNTSLYTAHTIKNNPTDFLKVRFLNRGTYYGDVEAGYIDDVNA